MGSESDREKMEDCVKVLKEAGVNCKVKVLSAHRSPEELRKFIKEVEGETEVFIAGAGLSAHLPGFVASLTLKPVIGVPLAVPPLNGLDSLLSIVQMPKGVPVATVGINNSKNAGILALQILALKEEKLKEKLKDVRAPRGL